MELKILGTRTTCHRTTSRHSRRMGCGSSRRPWSRRAVSVSASCHPEVNYIDGVEDLYVSKGRPSLCRFHARLVLVFFRVEVKNGRQTVASSRYGRTAAGHNRASRRNSQNNAAHFARAWICFLMFFGLWAFVFLLGPRLCQI